MRRGSPVNGERRSQKRRCESKLEQVWAVFSIATTLYSCFNMTKLTKDTHRQNQEIAPKKKTNKPKNKTNKKTKTNK